MLRALVSKTLYTTGMLGMTTGLTLILSQILNPVWTEIPYPVLRTFELEQEMEHLQQNLCSIQTMETLQKNEIDNLNYLNERVKREYGILMAEPAVQNYRSQLTNSISYGVLGFGLISLASLPFLSGLAIAEPYYKKKNEF